VHAPDLWQPSFNPATYQTTLACRHSRVLILKRLLPGAMRSGLREVHFGQRMRGVPGIARFVDAFESTSKLWLVFMDEGRSLHSLLYSTLETDAGAIMRPSVAWLRLRREPNGRLLLRKLVRDAASAIAACHALNVTHRDIKPPNLIIDLSRSPALRLADFGSAVDDVTLAPLHGLYPRGPSAAEETAGYQPPEAALGGVAFYMEDPRTYDLWSLGVVILELLLGTPDVFQPSPKAEARRRAQFEKAQRDARHRDAEANAQPRSSGHSSSTKEKAESSSANANSGDDPGATRTSELEGGASLGLDGRSGGTTTVDAKTLETRLRLGAALSEYCIQPTTMFAGEWSARELGAANLAPTTISSSSTPCGKAEFVSAIQRLDPLRNRGVALDEELLDLAFRLLRWEPNERLRAHMALEHPALVDADIALGPAIQQHVGTDGYVARAWTAANGRDHRGGGESQIVPHAGLASGCTALPKGERCTNRDGALHSKTVEPSVAPVSATADGTKAVIVLEKAS